MPVSHLLLMLSVIVAWGLNFIFVKLGLNEFPPLFLCALRFFLASIPAIFFIKRPDAPFKLVASYGLIMFGMQFALLFTGMHLGMTAGMASMLLQTQVFFSMIFASIFLKERIGFPQILGGMVSFTGIALVAGHFDNNISLTGFLCVLAGASTWGVANLITKKMKHVNMMALVVWGSFAASFPMLLLSFIFEGPHSMVTTLQNVSMVGIISLFYIVFASTWYGYSLWNWFLSRYPINTIAPFTLLVPVVGILASVIFLGEPFQLWKLVSGLLVISGLCIHLIGTRIKLARLSRVQA